jgi:hypothetical protein
MQLINSNQPNNIIEFRERYSNLLILHNLLFKESGSNNFPKFPPKRIFGNMKEDFVLEREKDLKTYFQKIFENQEFYKLKSLQNWIDNIIKNNKTKNQKEENIKNNNIIIDKYKKKEEEYIDTHFIDFFDFDNTDDENIGKPLKDENTINQIEFNSNIFLIPEGDDRNFDLIQQENQIIQYEDLLIDNLNLFINIINNKKLLYYENNNNLIDSFKI